MIRPAGRERTCPAPRRAAANYLGIPVAGRGDQRRLLITRPAIDLGSPFAVALGWNGTRWSKYSFPLWTSFNATAVFGPANAWALGENVMTRQPFVVRFGGHAWRKAAVPVVPQGASALSPSGIWIVGPRPPAKPGTSTFAVARWDGSSWHTVNLPRLPLPRGTALLSTDILALSPANVWVTGSLAAGRGTAPGFVLLHLTPGGWHRVAVAFPPGTLSGSPVTATAGSG